MLKINESYRSLIPALSEEEFKQLEENCIKEGIRDAIVTWNSYIVDGHNRYAIAEKHGLDYKLKEKSFKDENEVKEWMILNQFGRRNLSNYQRSLLALELEDVFREKAKENLRLSGGDKKSGCQISDNPIEQVDTKKELARVAKVSHDTIAKVKVIEQKAPEEVKQKLRSGETTINQVYQDIRKEEKKEERKKIIDEQINAIVNGELPELDGKFDIISVDPPWPYGRAYDPDGSRVANPYPEMSIDEIKKINLPSTNDSIVFLWTTHAFLPHSFEILKEWNYEYKATLVWDKENIGMGAWFRMQCEFCLIGIKGKPYWSNTVHRDIIKEQRREHSRKPDTFFKLVDEITYGRKLEYFSREKRNGWENYGNDINKF